jgi:hypothetical protein
MVLNGGTAIIAVIFIAYKPIMVSVLISYCTTLISTIIMYLLEPVFEVHWNLLKML